MEELAKMMFEFINENGHYHTFLDQAERKGFDTEMLEKEIEEHFED